jgi:hypothetical protein
VAATVTSDGVSDRYSITDSSDNPVMMPGSASGSTSSSDSEFFPKKRKRDSANAAALPSTSATAVAASPTLNEFSSAVRAV